MILITGASGTVGRELVKVMARPGAAIRIMVRDRVKAGSVSYPGVDIVQGDFGVPETLDDAMSGAHKAFLLTPPDQRQPEWESNFIEAARRSNLRHIVKLSALGASMNAPARLLQWHAESERKLESTGIPYTHLRPSQFMQNFLSFRPTIAGQGAFYAPMGNGRISLVDARDVAAVAAEVLTEFGHERKAYEITGPQALSYKDIAEILTGALGKPVQYVDVPPETARRGMLDNGMPDWFADALLELYAIWRANGASEISDAVHHVGKRTPTTFEQFARDFAPQLA